MFVLQADSHYHAGRYEEAKRASGQGIALNGAGLIFGMIPYIVITILNAGVVVGFSPTDSEGALEHTIPFIHSIPNMLHVSSHTCSL